MKEKNLTHILALAEQIATQAHKGQYRHDGKTPYITHPEAVAKTFNGVFVLGHQEEKIVSWLHDVVEDTTVTYSDLLEQGIPFHLVSIIEKLTHREEESYLDYLLRIKENELASRVKTADLFHNLSTSTSKTQKTKYQLALHILDQVEGKYE